MEKLSKGTKRFTALFMAMVLMMSMFANISFKNSRAEASADTATSTNAKVSEHKVSFQAVNSDGSGYLATDHEHVNLTGVVYAVYTDESCTDETDSFALSYNGKCYVDTDNNPVLYDSAESVPSSAKEKEITLKEGIYYIKQLNSIYDVVNGGLVKTDKVVEDSLLLRSNDATTISVTKDMTAKVVLSVFDDVSNDNEESVATMTDTDMVTSEEVTTEETTEEADEERVDTQLLFKNNDLVSINMVSQKVVLSNLAASGPYLTVKKFDGKYAKFALTGASGDVWCRNPGITAKSGYVTVSEWKGKNSKYPKASIYKAIYYNYQSPYSDKWSGWSKYSADDQYRIMTAVAGYINANSWKGHTGVQAAATSYLNWLNSQPTMQWGASSNFTLTKQTDTRFYCSNNDKFQYSEYKLTGSAYIGTIPSGVTVKVKASGAKSYSNATAGQLLSTGTMIRIQANLNKTGSSNVTFYYRCAKAYATSKPNGTNQSVAYGTRSRTDRTITVNWTYPMFTILKQSSDGKKLSDAEYEVFIEENGTKKRICNLYTGNDGVAEVSYVYNSKALVSSQPVEVGDNKIYYPVGTWIYINETAPPTGYALNTKAKSVNGNNFDFAFKMTNNGIEVSGKNSKACKYENASTVSGNVMRLVRITETDYPLGKLKLNKTVSNSNTSDTPLAMSAGIGSTTQNVGICFEVKDGSGNVAGSFITSYDGKCYVNPSTGARYVFANAQQLTAHVAQKDVAEYEMELAAGTYTVTELNDLYYPSDSAGFYYYTKADGYTLADLGVKYDGTSSQVTVTNGSVVTFTKDNTAVKGSLIIEKYRTDETGIKVKPAGASFAVYDSNNTKIATFTADGTKARAAVTSYTTTGAYAKLTASADKSRLLNIPVGKYTIKETACTYDSSKERVYKTPDATLTVTKTGQTLEWSSYPTLSTGSDGKYSASWTPNSAFSDTVDSTGCFTGDATVYCAENYYIDKAESVSLVIRKADADTGKSYSGSGSTSLEGAVFKVVYYKESNTATGTATGTWYFESKETGDACVIEFSPDYLYSGSKYVSTGLPEKVGSYGGYELESGTLVISEVEPPRGYLNIDGSGENRGFISYTDKTTNIQKKVSSNSITVYLEVGTGSQTFSVDNQIIGNEITYNDAAVRGDVRFSKKKLGADGGTSPMAGVVFKITNTETGEYHYAATDENGEFSSIAARANGTEYLNKNCALYEAGAGNRAKGTAGGYEKDETNSSYGVWFTADGADCASVTVDMMTANAGSFVCGKYEIEEVRCKANEGYNLADPVAFSITEDGQTVDLTTDEYVRDLHKDKSESGQTNVLVAGATFVNVAYPTLTTKSDKFIKKGDSVTLKDAVTISNLKENTTYTLKGIVMDKETGKAAVDGNGSYITSTQAFTTGKADAYGYVLTTTENVEFTDINSENMKSTYVVFEYLFEGTDISMLAVDGSGMPETSGAMTDDRGNVIGHADIANEDGSQTFDVSSITTKAFESETKESHIMADKNLAITDIVTYEGLTTGQEYTLTAKLAFVSGNISGHSEGELIGVTATKTFTPDEKDGEVKVEFKPFDATPYDGCVIVVYEYLYNEAGDLIAAEEDTSEESQQIHFISVHTNSNDEFNPAEYLKRYDKDVTLVDKVTCTNLEVGRSYKVDGTLMTEDGEEVTNSKGEVIKGSTTFEATEADMVVDVVFNYNPLDCGLASATVVFEDLFVDEKKVASHADLSDAPQTNYYPSIETKLVTTADGLRYIEENADGITMAVLTDKVSYKNIPEGTSFTVVGKLVNKATGETIKADGEEITATETFVSNELNGTVDLEFPEFDLDSTGIHHTGKDNSYFDAIVAYEYLYAGDTVSEDTLIAYEENIDNENQTIRTMSLHTTATDKNTGNNVVAVSKMSTLVDKVRYTGLIVGKEYTVSGTLMCKETKEEVKTSKGKKITASTTFVAKETDGYVDVIFTYDAVDCGLVGKTIVAFENLIPTDGDVYAHEDLSDEDQTVYVPEVKTVLSSNGNKVISDADVISLTDKISISNLAAGNTYKAEVTLYDVVTKKPVSVDGKSVTKTVDVPAVATNTDASRSGAVSAEKDVTFDTFSGTDAGIIADDGSVHALSAVTTLYVKNGDNWVAAYTHNENLADKDETVTLYNPQISTSFHVKGSESRAFNADAKKVSLTDTVKYSGLEKGKTYELYAYVYNRNTGKALRSGGEQICVIKKFTAQAGSGSVDVEFTLKPSELGIIEEDGTCAPIVCFENLYKDGVKIAEHASLKYEKQTVYPVPSGHTKAEDKASGTQSALPTGSVTIVDHISYTNLVVGREYTVTGTLMDKETGKPLGIDGSTKTVKFKPTKTTGIYDMEFTIDASALVGKAIVVFENVKYKKTEVFTHEDLSDDNQTITFPKIGTTATVGGGKKLVRGKVNTITDTIRYEKLDAEETYKITAKLVKKSDGSVVATSTKKFTPGGKAKFASGSTVMTLSFNVPDKQTGSAQYVVYEYIYSENDTLIAKHEDINDEDQTVEISYAPQTGDMVRLGLLIGMFAAAACGIIITTRVKKKRKSR